MIVSRYQAQAKFSLQRTLKSSVRSLGLFWMNRLNDRLRRWTTTWRRATSPTKRTRRRDVRFCTRHREWATRNSLGKLEKGLRISLPWRDLRKKEGPNLQRNGKQIRNWNLSRWIHLVRQVEGMVCSGCTSELLLRLGRFPLSPSVSGGSIDAIAYRSLPKDRFIPSFGAEEDWDRASATFGVETGFLFGTCFVWSESRLIPNEGQSRCSQRSNYWGCSS